MNTVITIIVAIGILVVLFYPPADFNPQSPVLGEDQDHSYMEHWG